MILTHSIKVCLATQPCDLRKSFDTLCTVVREHLGEDPLSRKVYVFLNRSCDRVKMLYWDGTGLWILTKRLERGRFCHPRALAGERMKLALKPDEKGDSQKELTLAHLLPSVRHARERRIECQGAISHVIASPCDGRDRSREPDDPGGNRSLAARDRKVRRLAQELIRYV